MVRCTTSGVLPQHVAPLIVTVGDPERVVEVSRHFDQIDFRQNRREFVTHVGRFAGRRIMCISTGIGTDNVDIVLNELDALANVDFATQKPKAEPVSLTLVRLGTSGTLQADIPMDTLLISRAAVGLDGLGPSYRVWLERRAGRVTAAVSEVCGGGVLGRRGRRADRSVR